MESKDILKILENFNDDKAYKKIFINGKWGIGKSFYANKFKQDKNNIIYTSLFGKDSLAIIEEDIAKELLKKINSVEKYKKIGKKVIKNVAGSVSFNGFSIKTPEIESKSFIEEYYKILDKEENLIIIIDDLERKSSKVKIEDILGLIEQISLCQKIKIVIIGYEDEIIEKEIWKSFKEKIIEKEYKIIKFSRESIDSLLISRLNEYINKEELEKFIENFFNEFKVDNLRTINKGVNLFLEIEDKFLNKKYNDAINIIILKTCMSVAIEVTEKLFEPKESKNKNNGEIENYYNELDEDMQFRIERHYFNSYIMVKKEAALVHYILAIFKGEYTKNTISDFNNVIENYINVETPKNIFYLNERQIKNIVKRDYKDILEEKYIFQNLDKLMDDIYNIINWFNVFNIKYDKKELEKKFKNILLKNHYKKEKNLEEIQIDMFSLKYETCKTLRIFVKDYNDSATEKYYLNKLQEIENTFKLKEYNIDKLRWIERAFIQSDKDIQIERFIKIARKNNYFISDMSKEISEREWKWLHYISSSFYDYMNKKYIDEFNIFLDSMKGKNVIQDYRINFLQQNNRG